MPANLIYGDSIARYFAQTRSKWDEFYPSERWIFEKTFAHTPPGRVLDIGCAGGGLGLALSEKYQLESYTGVDISPEGIQLAVSRKDAFKMPAEFICGDVLEIRSLPETSFPTVVNLSCADWNVQTDAIIQASWKYVAPGGRLIISVRLTDGEGINDMSVSYQNLDVSGDQPARANYLVFNVKEFLTLLENLDAPASQILGYGYWGPPSKTAVTPYSRLAFSVFAITKAPTTQSPTPPASDLRFPLSLWTGSAK